jgi:hypothetical protein
MVVPSTRQRSSVMKAKTSFMFVMMFVSSMPLFAQTGQTSMQKGTEEGMFTITETRYWDISKAQNGYTLFAASGKSYLIDMEGYILKQWNVGTNPRLLENGNLLDATKSDPRGFGGFQEIDWNGNVVWTYTEKRSNYFPHHDWTRIYNKKLKAYTTIYIANKNVPKDSVLAAGANPANGSYTDVQMDALVEVDSTGTIVWEWWFFNHIIQDFDATKPNYVGAGKTVANYPNKININMSGNPLKSDWLHCNSIDYNDSLGHLVTNSVQGEFYIIDHDNTFIAGNPAGSIALAASSAGDFLYRFGDPYRYNQGTAASINSTGNKQIGGSHDVHWIKSGLPGAGNIQIFNNGEYLGERVSQSYIFEVNPYYNSSRVNTGAYINPPAAGYYTWTYPNKDAMKANKLISNQVVWIYASKNDQNFYSTIGGSEQRLPNGNTLICSDTHGHLFEVTANDTTIVWEYINPVTKDGIKTIITDQYPMYNSVFRAYRYTSDYAAFKGRTLTKTKTITSKTPQYFKPSDLSGGTSSSEIATPQELELHQNYPNPFNPSTSISFSLDRPAYVSLKVYNMLGEEVAVLASGELSSGTHMRNWNGSDMASGTYFYRLQVSSISNPGSVYVVQTGKMLLLR